MAGRPHNAQTMTTTSPWPTLQAGALRLALRPDLGGAIAGLWLDDVPVLRSSEADALAASRDSGCYPLVPYSNRLGYRRFTWKGRSYETRANFDGEPHSLHGVGWQRAWQVTASAADRAVLELTHVSDADWPFAFHAEQVFELTPDALRVTLTVDQHRRPHGARRAGLASVLPAPPAQPVASGGAAIAGKPTRRSCRCAV